MKRENIFAKREIIQNQSMHFKKVEFRLGIIVNLLWFDQSGSRISKKPLFAFSGTLINKEPP